MRKEEVRGFRHDGNQGFLYLQVTKTSTLAQGANWYPFKNYLVNSDWIMNLWQQDKVTAQTARAVIAQCKRNVPRLLENYETIDKEP